MRPGMAPLFLLLWLMSSGFVPEAKSQEALAPPAPSIPRSPGSSRGSVAAPAPVSQPGRPLPGETPADLPSALADPPDEGDSAVELDDDSSAALLLRMKRLEREVEDVKALRQRVAELESELETLKSQDDHRSAPRSGMGQSAEEDDERSALANRSFHHLFGTAPRDGESPDDASGQNGESQTDGDSDDPTAGYSQSSGEGTFSAGGGGGAGPSSGGTSGAGRGSVGRGERVGERQPLQINLTPKYKYNFAGGFFQFSDEDGEFVLNVQNIVTADGTYHDRQNPPTEWQGFNIPFQRLYLYGNITKNWEYQVSEQSSLGNINLLDLVVNVHYDDRLMIKAGKFLAPFYYQDYATFPMLVPAITYSPLSQFSAQREPGVMAWGKLFENRLQYQAGVFTGIPASFFDLDNNVDFISSLTVMPFMASEFEELRNFGFGVSSQVGWQDYMLDAIDVPTVIAGTDTPNLNRQFVTASNVPFFTYRDDVRALGERVRVAPHLFYYGRFSFLGEYVYQSRELASPLARGTSIQHGFYATASYLLTGERYTGDGTGGFPTIMPNRPFNPTNNEYGPGAHELAFQYTLLNVGEADIRRGFADPVWATRLNEIMVGYNWWPNKYVRLSVNWIHDELNRPFPWPIYQQDRRNGGRTNAIQEFNVVWFRLAMFF